MACRCGVIGFPVDAVWLQDDLILAVYKADCGHVPETVRIVRPSDLQPEGRCIGMTAAGTRCRRHPTGGSWCSQHAPDRQICE